MRGRRARGSAQLWRESVGLWLAFMALVTVLWPMAARAQDADCAEVKIVIEQKLSLERQAFDAHMIIRNGLDGQLTNVKVHTVGIVFKLRHGLFYALSIIRSSLSRETLKKTF